MKIIATQKFIRMSPRKIRLVADMVRGLSPKDAAEILPQIGKRAGLPLGKVVKTAIANANVQGISENDLTFAEIQINEGPSLKRGRPVSRGRWHPFKRRMSHIRIVLETKEMKKQGTKEGNKGSVPKTRSARTGQASRASNARSIRGKKGIGGIKSKLVKSVVVKKGGTRKKSA